MQSHKMTERNRSPKKIPTTIPSLPSAEDLLAKIERRAIGLGYTMKEVLLEIGRDPSSFWRWKKGGAIKYADLSTLIEHVNSLKPKG